jgi:hypothetical protein
MIDDSIEETWSIVCGLADLSVVVTDLLSSTEVETSDFIFIDQEALTLKFTPYVVT